MPTFKFAKLVRNNIWKWHEEAGHTVDGQLLHGEDLKQALATKLHEESDEVAAANTREELIEEIADVQQIIKDLCTLEGIATSEIEQVRKEKATKKGGFLGGMYIDTVTMPNEDDTWVYYCRKNNSKYPELQTSGHIDPDLPELEKGVYCHNKSGQLYEVIAVTLDTENHQPLVVYRPLYDSKYELFARPYASFTEAIELDGKEILRFSKIND
jgi:predicted house-cleaning noncanonical NTP pyrophosphatase (MazG superfamily)